MPTPVRLPHSLPHSWRAENKSEKQPKYVMQAIIIAYRPGPRPRPPKTSPDNRKRRSQSQSPPKKKRQQKPPWPGLGRVDDWKAKKICIETCDFRHGCGPRSSHRSQSIWQILCHMRHSVNVLTAWEPRTERTRCLQLLIHSCRQVRHSPFFRLQQFVDLIVQFFLSFGNLCLISRRGIFLWIICSHSWALMRRHARFCRNYVACRGWFWNFSFDSTQICQDQWWR